VHADIYSFYDGEKYTVGTPYNNGEIHPVNLQRPLITDDRNDQFGDEHDAQLHILM
jgi:hypothetical protein